MLDVNNYVQDKEDNNLHQLDVVVSGIHCISCVKSIENKLYSFPEVKMARVNFSTKRLSFTWEGEKSTGNILLKAVNDLGFEAKPYLADSAEASSNKEVRFILKSLAVAGFAMGNIMLLSFAVWSNSDGKMGHATQLLFYWLTALIAVPAIAYSGRPFFRSAIKALSQRQTNMDVPISVALILATGLSLFQLIYQTEHELYFDSAVMLMFFLLIGRYLNIRARGQAKSAAANLLSMLEGTATIINKDGKYINIPFKDVKEDMLLNVAAGEKIAADGIVEDGITEIDTSLLTGETLPKTAKIGDEIFAGTINIANPIKVRVTKSSHNSLLSDIIRLMENAEQGNAKFVRLSDKVAKLYTPIVHSLALITLLFWYFIMSAGFEQSLVYAISMLIITCPCAIGLAVPVVQVLASGRLFKKGILLKSGDGLEKLSKITYAFFDKTGTLTLGKLTLNNGDKISSANMQLAASLAVNSTHPLSQAIVKDFSGKLFDCNVKDTAGHGLESVINGKRVRLGKLNWVLEIVKDNVKNHSQNDSQIELWLAIENKEPVRLTFDDSLRQDSKQVIEILKNNNITTSILSGDRKSVVKKIASELAVDDYIAPILPDQKLKEIQKQKQAGNLVLMVGDGLNDAPALTTADVSISHSGAMMISQNAADIVFQSDKLFPVIEAWQTAKITTLLTKQNLCLAFTYNFFAIPLAFAGFITPLIAAIAMSLSSITVIMNSMRLNRKVNREIKKLL